MLKLIIPYMISSMLFKEALRDRYLGKPREARKFETLEEDAKINSPKSHTSQG
jgi:hypothetical protein